MVKYLPDGAVMLPMLTLECKRPWTLFEVHKIGFRGKKHTHTQWNLISLYN